jgi:hypothetical protein
LHHVAILARETHQLLRIAVVVAMVLDLLVLILGGEQLNLLSR